MNNINMMNKLVAAQKEYISFLHADAKANTGYFLARCITTPNEVFEEGVRLRKAISDIENIIGVV